MGKNRPACGQSTAKSGQFPAKGVLVRDALYPNRLRELLTIAGYKHREVYREADIAERTFRRYLNGERIISHEDRLRLAHILNCTVQDLAPHHERQRVARGERAKGAYMFEAIDTHFCFGPIKTTTETLDGTGIEAYIPSNIHTRYDPEPATFFDEVLQAKREIEQEQEAKRLAGEPYQWNGEKYHLSKTVISREPTHEYMTLGLWFKPRDHYTGLATRRCLDKQAFRQKYLEEHDWYTPIVGMSMSMGVNLTAISSDGFAFLTQRGAHQSVHQNMLHTSVSEAVSPSFDWNTTTQSPDLYRTACRGLAEELGMQEHVDFSVTDVLFLSFTVDTHYALYGMQGIVHVKRSAEEIAQRWHAGIKDKLESKLIFPVRFTPEDIAAFVFSPDRHESWGGGLICLYHSLVYEFGHERVDRVIDSYS